MVFITYRRITFFACRVSVNHLFRCRLTADINIFQTRPISIRYTLTLPIGISGAHSKIAYAVAPNKIICSILKYVFRPEKTLLLWYCIFMWSIWKTWFVLKKLFTGVLSVFFIEMIMLNLSVLFHMLVCYRILEINKVVFTLTTAFPQRWAVVKPYQVPNVFNHDILLVSGFLYSSVFFWETTLAYSTCSS